GLCGREHGRGLPGGRSRRQRTADLWHDSEEILQADAALLGEQVNRASLPQGRPRGAREHHGTITCASGAHGSFIGMRRSSGVRSRTGARARNPHGRLATRFDFDLCLVEKTSSPAGKSGIPDMNVRYELAHRRLHMYPTIRAGRLMTLATFAGVLAA